MNLIKFGILLVLLFLFLKPNSEGFYPQLGGYFVRGANEKCGYGGLARFPNNTRKWKGHYWRGSNGYPYFW